jgi:AbiV family abortive infection protein
MLSVKKEVLLEGVQKTVDNAQQLINLAVDIRDQSPYSNKAGYSAMLMQTGLEELAKASFLFEKYLRSIIGGHALLSNEERALWLGGKESHHRRVNRIHQLYSLAMQVALMPGTSVVFPQGPEELLHNRNIGLYVDFSHEDNQFKSPSEWVATDYLTAIPSFAREFLHFCRYDYVVDKVEVAVNKSRKNKRKLIRVMRDVIDEKRQDALSQIDKWNNDHPNETIDRGTEEIYCVNLLPDEAVQIIYGVTTDPQRHGWFLMDYTPAVAIISKDCTVTHNQMEIPDDPDEFFRQRERELKLHGFYRL